ncbi:bifunctional P-loop containing nucleoside triphosphate hydrolase/Small GTPase/Small GTP-binding protein domain [Babesia duncani]|uniref:Bifunctional P-loop containing nucleoside triphosphate hydrolase/Small GTPase/Small GTP-binding protein domain n=1 Tax=Babesia duncani TaxID=323732 RepID=A0AAD9PIK2_9APIC|nr:bifunctional P-loop containing nucleoside triphosphate hydrolase/Small GTPase/Small GTP-binding protein domain [Babesia duncani]
MQLFSQRLRVLAFCSEMEEDDYEHVYKIILLGDATVGKSHLLSQYIKGSLPQQPKATIGVEFATRTVPLASGGTVKAQIWDTAGQERYRSITSAHYRRAVGALLVYDVTNRHSFNNCQKWLDELRSAAEPEIVVVLLGNKIDLVQQDPAVRQVHFDQAAIFANEWNLHLFEASAVTGHNVKSTFEFLLQEIHNIKSRAEASALHAEARISPMQLDERPQTRTRQSRASQETELGCLEWGSCGAPTSCNIQ